MVGAKKKQKTKTQTPKNNPSIFCIVNVCEFKIISIWPEPEFSKVQCEHTNMLETFLTLWLRNGSNSLLHIVI